MVKTYKFCEWFLSDLLRAHFYQSGQAYKTREISKHDTLIQCQLNGGYLRRLPNIKPALGQRHVFEARAHSNTCFHQNKCSPCHLLVTLSVPEWIYVSSHVDLNRI